MPNATNPGATIKYNPANPYNLNPDGTPMAGTGNFSGGAMPTVPAQVASASTAPQPNAGSVNTTPPPIVSTPEAATANLNQIKQATENIVAGQQAQKAAQTSPPIQPPQPTQIQTGTENYYYTKSQDATGKPVITYYDQNGNVLLTNPIGGDQYAQNPEATPNAQGRLIQLTNAPTEGGFTQTPQTTGQYNAQLQGLTQTQQQNLFTLNQQTDTAFADYQNKLNAIQNGTFPLTPQQQAILDETNAQFQALRQQQTIANTALTQGTQVFEARTGGLTGGIQTAMGNVGNAINTGIQKLNELDSKAAQTLAQLQSGFQSDNLKLITDSWTAWQTYANQKEKTINDIYSTTSQAVKDLRDSTIKQAQQNFDNSMATQKESFTERIQTLDQILKQAQLDETTRHNIVNEATQNEIAAHGRYEVVTNPVDGSQSILDKETGKFVGTPNGTVQNGQLNGVNDKGTPISIGNTGIPLLDANTTITTSGIPFVNGENLSGKQAVGIQNEAAKLGIPYLGKTSVTALNVISKARNSLKDIQSQFMSFGATDATGRILGAPSRALSSIFQTNDQIASWNAWRTGAIQTIQGLAAGGTGLRITQAEINSAMQYDLPTINDTVGVANAKIAKLTAMLDGAEAPLFGGNDKYNWLKAANSPTPLQTYANSGSDYAKMVGNALTKFPTYTDNQIMQILPGDITNWAFNK